MELRTVGSALVVVLAIATAALSAQPVVTIDACLPPDTDSLTATASGPVAECSYSWTLTGGTISEGQGSGTLTFVSGPPGTAITVAAEASGPAGCEGTGTATARTSPLAEASGGGTICPGSSIQLSGSGGSSCLWSPAEGLDDPQSCTPVASPSAMTTYNLTVTDDAGCASTNEASTHVRIGGRLPLPSSITVEPYLPPNTPGLTARAPFCRDSRFYHWFIEGGTITGGRSSAWITFTSGPPGTRVGLGAAGACHSYGGVAQVDFADVPPDDFFHDDIGQLGRHRITAGCGEGNFCPDDFVRRDQLAVFLTKAQHGSICTPRACEGRFEDVACSDPFANFIEQLAFDGITAGCGNANFCPKSWVNRAQMSVFLLKSRYGADHVPPHCTGLFADVACPGPFADWIEEAYVELIVGACHDAPLRFCPDYAVTRGFMASFLVRAFGLH